MTSHSLPASALSRLGQSIGDLRASPAFAAHLPRLLLLLATLTSGFAALAGLRRLSVDPESIAIAETMLRAWSGEPAAPPSAASAPPGYALVLAALAAIVPGLRTSLACAAGPAAPCALAALVPLVLIQLAAALATLVTAFHLARRLSGDTTIALIAVTLFYFATRPGSFAAMLRGQTWLVLLLMLHLLALVEAADRPSPLWPLASGAALGAATLFQPIAAVLLLVAPLALASTPPLGSGPLRATRGAGLLLAAATGTSATLLALATGFGYDPENLLRGFGIDFAQRLAFARIGFATTLAVVITSVPVLGDIVASLLPASELRLVSVGGVEGSLAHAAAARDWPAALARSGGASQAAIVLLARDQLAAAPLAYPLSLVPVLMRGLFAGGGLVALIGLFHIRPMLAFARADASLPLHRLMLLPVLALLAANVLFTGNAFWGNPLLPFVYAYAIAYVASGW